MTGECIWCVTFRWFSRVGAGVVNFFTEVFLALSVRWVSKGPPVVFFNRIRNLLCLVRTLINVLAERNVRLVSASVSSDLNL